MFLRARLIATLLLSVSARAADVPATLPPPVSAGDQAVAAPAPVAASAPSDEVLPPQMKTIELEWEALDNAFGYEVRLTPETGKPIFFRTMESRLSEEVPVGVYSLRIRSRHREHDLWSDWSDPIRFEVLKKELELLEPKHEEVLTAQTNAREEVQFKWTEVAKAKRYTLSIWTEETKEKPLIFVTGKNSQRLKLLPGQIYFWQVTFESATNVNYVQVIKTFSFTVQGPKLVKPSILPFKPGEPQVKLTWLSSKRAKSHKAKLSFRYLDEAGGKEIKVTETEAREWAFGELPAGAYKLEVQAFADRSAPSDPGV